ncbi:uncharacterized protein LOC123260206 [Cotesia glomerata]|uniref:uncharacterized protein LOC123260206 n=1 Tax=Cotesia glomerata TaxID=32391 RepID=UPI001D00C8EA|nr:uncharacterized protein LOC123260206 [Cotesia glomerata]
MTEKIKKYAVIEFDETINNNKVVELVPIDWLTEDETMCLWPPKKDEDKVEKWVEFEVGPYYETWLKYPIKIISKAKDYAQGLRRLKKSYKTKDVESTESESMNNQNTEPMLFSSTHVSQLLSRRQPLNTGGNTQSHTGLSDVLDPIAELSEFDLIHPNDHLEAEKSNEAAFGSTMEPKSITNYDDLAKYLQRIICTEMSKVKRNVNYTIGQQVKKILEVVQQSADAPSKQKAWNIIGDNLPYGDIATFVEFDEFLKNTEEKRKALVFTNYLNIIHKDLQIVKILFGVQL